MRPLNAFKIPAGLSATDRFQAILSLVIKISLVVAVALAFIDQDWTTLFVAAVTLMVTLLPWFLSTEYKTPLPVGFEFLIVSFVYATLFLGEVHGFYARFWWWDVVLHTGSGLAFGFIGFLVLYSFYRVGKFDAPPAQTAQSG